VHILQPGPEVLDPLARYAQVDRSTADGRCWVLANMVGGLDGTASIGGRVGELSAGPDRALFRALRSLADVVMVGAETVRRERYGAIALDPEQAAARRAAGRPAAPPESRTLVITCAAADPGRLRLARQAADVIIAGQDRVEPGLALRQLAGRGQHVVLCEGGPGWLGQLAAAGLLDELCLTIAPLIGGDPLPLSVTPPGAPPAHFELRQVLADASTLFLRYEQRRDDR
jgi:riboflavin biosynthesis pyrimidine reductase